MSACCMIIASASFQVVTKVNEKHICSFDEVTSLVPTLLRPVTIGFDDERVVEEGVALPSQASQLLYVSHNYSVCCCGTCIE